jgi:hypothetical protein
LSYPGEQHARIQAMMVGQLGTEVRETGKSSS